MNYQWKRDGNSIAGTTNAITYTMTSADNGTDITVTVSYTDFTPNPNITSTATSNPITGVATTI